MGYSTIPFNGVRYKSKQSWSMHLLYGSLTIQLGTSQNKATIFEKRWMGK